MIEVDETLSATRSYIFNVREQQLQIKVPKLGFLNILAFSGKYPVSLVQL